MPCPACSTDNPPQARFCMGCAAPLARVRVPATVQAVLAARIDRLPAEEKRLLQARCHLGLGRLLRQTGHHDEAHAELSTAVTMLREMEMTYWLPEAEAALGARSS